MPVLLNSKRFRNKDKESTKTGGALKITDDETIYKAMPSGQVGRTFQSSSVPTNANQATKAPSSVVSYGGELLSNVVFRNRDKNKSKNVKLAI